MRIDGLLLTNILLLIVNLLTVIGNIYIPRLINEPEVQIVSVSALADEVELAVPRSVSRVIAAAISVREDGDEYYSDRKCYDALREFDFVPSSCRAKFVETLNTITKNAEIERNAKREALIGIDDFDEAELVRVLQSSTALGYLSTFYNDVFFNILAAENIARDELAEPMRTALIDTALALVDREYLFLDSFEVAMRSMSKPENEIEEPTVVVLRVVVLNSGFSADLIDPTAKLTIGQRTLNLRLVNRDSLGESELKVSEHRAAAPGEAQTLYYHLDPRLNTVGSNELAQEVFLNSASIPFQLFLEGTKGAINKSGSIEPAQISFEMDFGT